MPIGGIQSNIPVSIGGSINVPRPTSRGSEQIPSSQSDPISSLLKQLQQQKQSTPQVSNFITNSKIVLNLLSSIVHF